MTIVIAKRGFNVAQNSILRPVWAPQSPQTRATRRRFEARSKTGLQVAQSSACVHNRER